MTEERTSSSPDAARRARLDRAARDGVDVVVVGGGITGAGIARDAALRGLRVLIVDKGDWASGTSSKSSKLVHGGLRYLERFQLGLVLESSRERARLQRDNPNLVWPLDFLMPVYEGDKHGLLKLDLGLWLYDLLALSRGHGRHRRVKPAEAAARAPGLATGGLAGALVFRDCGTNDARLVLANVLDAARHGALCASHTRLERLEYGPDGRVTHAIVRDLVHDRELAVPARHVAHAMGPWSDDAATPTRERSLMRPTKGVHIVVPRARLPVSCAVGLTSPLDQRANFVVPAGDTTYIGTTDTDYDGDLDDVRVDEGDVAYLLATVARYFPEARLTAADVTSTWAGLRPLLRDDATTAYRTSREHEVFVDPRGLTTIAGGKLTTYRAMAEEATDAVARDLRRFGLKPRRCTTHRRPLDPALPAVADPARGPDGPLERALWRLHGSGAAWVKERLGTHPDEAERLAEEPLTVLAQVSLAVLHEQAVHLDDVLVRRLLLYLQAPDQGLGAAPRVARHMARLLDRDDAWVAAELAAYEALVARARAAVVAPPALAEPARGGYR